MKHKRKFQKRSTNKREVHIFEISPEYYIKYNELMKESRMWNGMSQYWLGEVAKSRANCLLGGDITSYNEIIKTEEYIHETRRLNLI